MNLLLLREAFKRTNQEVLHSDGFKFFREVLSVLLFATVMLTLIFATAYVVGIVIFNNTAVHGVVIAIGALLYPMLFFTYVKPFYENLQWLKKEDRLMKERIKEGIK